MALKNNWNDLVDGESFVEVEPINRMAHAIIANEENILSVQKLSESIQAENKSQEAEIIELSKDLTRFEGDAVMLDSKINENKKRITNLERGIPSDLFLTDNSIAYSKNVPRNALPYAEVRKIGGVTRKCTNLLPYPYTETTKTMNGITYTDNGDGTITVNGTSTGQTNSNFFFASNEKFSLPVGTYTFSVNYIIPNGVTVWLYKTSESRVIAAINAGEQYRTFTLAKEESFNVYIFVSVGVSFPNVVLKPMLNEGSTALPYEPYFDGLRSAPVTEVESVGANETVIGTLPIPESVQALDGYGDGVNESVYNYIDFDKKQFVKRVGKVDMGTLATPLKYDVAEGSLFRFIVEDIKLCGSADIVANILCSKYATTSTVLREDKTTSMPVNLSAVDIIDNGYTDAATFKAAMSGVMLYYELATPVVTDISDLVSEDNFIGVEGNGTITMANQYKYNVPSEIVFMLDEV